MGKGMPLVPFHLNGMQRRLSVLCIVKEPVISQGLIPGGFVIPDRLHSSRKGLSKQMRISHLWPDLEDLPASGRFQVVVCGQNGFDGTHDFLKPVRLTVAEMHTHTELVVLY